MAQGSGGAGTPNDPQLASSGKFRVWLQMAIDNPSVQSIYMGRAQLEKADADLGASEPVYLPSSTQRDMFDIVDTIKRSPTLPKTSITQHVRRFLTDEWFTLRNTGCYFNVRALVSNCARPDDPTQWDAQVLFGKARLTKLGLPLLNVLDGAKNEIVDLTGDIESQLLAFIYPMQFQQVADVTVLAELVDGFYYDAVSCGDCGSPSDGCQKLYGLQIANAGSPGLSSQIVYSQDGGATWAAMDIPTLGGLSASRFAPMGVFCIVISVNQGAYHYARFTDILNGTVNWTQQTTGFVAGKSPKCIAVKDPTTCFIGAQAGYIYLLNQVGNAVTVLTDGTVNAQDVNDIHYFGRTVVAVQNNNGVLYSANNGQSWVLLTGPLVGQNLAAVWCLNSYTWFVGTGNGQLWYTTNAGVSWTRLLFDAGNFTTINDIQFYYEGDTNVGYIAVEIAGAARVYRTVDAGASWQYNSSAITPLPTPVQRINVLAPCGYNTVAAFGRKTVGGDGMLAIAKNAN